MGRRLLRDYKRKKLRSLARKQFTSKQHRWIRRQDRYMKSGRLMLNAAARKIQHRFRYRSLAKPYTLPFRTRTLTNRTPAYVPPPFRSHPKRMNTPPRLPASKRQRNVLMGAGYAATAAASAAAAAATRAIILNRLDPQTRLQNKVYLPDGTWRSNV